MALENCACFGKSIVMRAFIKSALYGAIAAAILPTLLAVGIVRRMVAANYMQWSDNAAMAMVVLPFVVALIFAVVAMTAVGIPARQYLRARGSENGMGYVVVGVLTGLVVPLVLWLSGVMEDGAEFLPLFGAIGGAVTGWTWWRSAHPVAVADR